MAYVITEACVGVCDTACAMACPVDCIAGPVPIEEIELVPPRDRAARFGAIQLYIDPALCIDCQLCQPACPVDAIYPEGELPPELAHHAEGNAAFFAPRARGADGAQSLQAD